MSAGTPLVRLATAILVLVASIAGAFVLHSHREGQRVPCNPAGPASPTMPTFCIREHRPGWVDPAALGIVLVGLVTAAALLTARSGWTPAHQSS